MNRDLSAAPSRTRHIRNCVSKGKNQWESYRRGEVREVVVPNCIPGCCKPFSCLQLACRCPTISGVQFCYRVGDVNEFCLGVNNVDAAPSPPRTWRYLLRLEL